MSPYDGGRAGAPVAPAPAPAAVQVAEQPAGSHGTGLIAVAGFSCLVVALQQTLVVPAVPVLPELLGASAVAVSWLVTATLLTGSVATPIIARLSDMYGRKRMLIAAMTFVLIGSVIAPLGGLTTLIIGRGLQGLGTALVPVAMAQMRDSLPRHRISSSLAILSATLGVGGGIGIPLGGVILQAWGWQSLFWASALLAIASIALIAVAVPRHDPADPGRFDLTGAVLLTIGLSALLVAISQGNLWGWLTAKTLITVVVAVGVLGVWVVHQLRSSDPIVDIQATTSTPLLFTNIASLVLGVLMFTNLLLTTQVLQNPVEADGFAWTSAAAGLAMLPNALAMFGVAPLSAWLAERWGARTVLAIGGVITALGYVLRMVASDSGALVIIWATVIGVGVGIGYAALPMLIVRYSPAKEIGAANGTNALVRAIGTAIASASVAAVASVLTTTVGGAVVPSGAAFTTVCIAAVIGGLATVLCAVLARGTVHVHE